MNNITLFHRGAKVITAFERKLIFDNNLQAIARLAGLDFTSF